MKNLALEKGKNSAAKRVSSVPDAEASPPSSSSFFALNFFLFNEPLFLRRVL